MITFEIHDLTAVNLRICFICFFKTISENWQAGESNENNT